VSSRFSPASHVEALLDSYRAARGSWSAEARGHGTTAGLTPSVG
jgi:hypothetical protein